MIKKTVVMLAVALCSTAPAAYAAVNLVANGSFEDSTPGYTGSLNFQTVSAGDPFITGWTVSQGSVDLIGTYWQAAEGINSVDMDGNGQGQIYQNVSLVSGQQYLLTFNIAGNPDDCPGPLSCTKNLDLQVGVSVANQQYSFTVDGTQTHSAMGYVLESLTFTANSTGLVPLTFSSLTTGSYGVVLDNVSVVAVPESETWAMMLVGMGLVGLRLRKNNHKESRLLS